MKESTRLEVVLGGVREALVSEFTVARACRLLVEYVIPLIFEPPMITFTVLLGVGSVG